MAIRGRGWCLEKEKALLVTEIKPVLMVSLGVERVRDNLVISCLRFISNHNIVVVREIIEDNIVQVKVEPAIFVKNEQPESIRRVDSRVETACKTGRGEEEF